MPKTYSLIPALNAAAAASIDGCCALLPLQSFGWPSVDSTIIGGEPAGAGCAMKSATTFAIAGAVGVEASFCGGVPVISAATAFAFANARGVEGSGSSHFAPGNIETPKYAEFCRAGTMPV